MSRRWLAGLALAAFTVAPAFGGVTFKVSQKTEGTDTMGGNTLMQVWTASGEIKAEYLIGQEPMMPAGSYVLTRKGTAEPILVNPRTKTWSRFGSPGTQDTMATMMKSMEGMMKIQYTDLKVEDLGEDDGGVIEGFPTRRHRVRVAWTREMKMPMMSQKSHEVIEETVWMTKAVDAGALPWMTAAPHTGNAEFDERILAGLPKPGGFLLKRVRTTKSSGMGPGSTFTETTLVSEVKTTDLPAGIFEMPAGYRETNMTSGSAQMPDLPD